MKFVASESDQSNHNIKIALEFLSLFERQTHSQHNDAPALYSTEHCYHLTETLLERCKMEYIIIEFLLFITFEMLLLFLFFWKYTGGRLQLILWRIYYNICNSRKFVSLQHRNIEWNTENWDWFCNRHVKHTWIQTIIVRQFLDNVNT